MKPAQTFAQKYPAYMTAETTKRTIELGRAVRAQLARRRGSVTINVDTSAVDNALRGLLNRTTGSA